MGSSLKKLLKGASKSISDQISKRIISKEEIGSFALTASASFMGRVLMKRGVRTNIKFLIESKLFNEIESKEIPAKTMQDAAEVLAIFKRAGIVPEKIAIDGVPGSGKTSLSYALGKVLDVKPVCLDHFNMDKKINFVSKPAIFEHHRLLRTQEIDCFDAIIYIDEPIEISKEKILLRRRGSYLVDIMNFELMKRIGKKAFELADGEIYQVPDSFISDRILGKLNFSNICLEL
ncbi:MAG: hypothetical protein HQK66_14830 [Desulfamplus sp.]|nr:hypothetical protein [Desulfamplus sp.]